MRLATTIPMLLLLAGNAQAQQVYRCINPTQTQLEYSDKPCPEGSSAAVIDVTPNSAATAGALAAGHSATAGASPPQQNGPVNNPLKADDEPSAEESNAWAKSNPKSQASTSFDQETLPRRPSGGASK
jgi:hypothetical protein